MASQETTDFGYQRVALGAKQARVDEVFRTVARRYDLMNDLMSAGLHRIWKDALVSALYPRRTRPHAHLDLAGGTGDVAFRILAANPAPMRVTLLDINGEMLAIARERAGALGIGERLTLVEANAETLPFPENSFESCSIAFGIRNVPRIDTALAEIYRVLKRGGRFLCLEFSPVELPLLDRLYEAYSFGVIPRLGAIVTGDAEPYRYLVESIRRFPDGETFAMWLGQAGFARVSQRAFTGGIVRLHAGWKV